jgi:SulP family sulfate permease
MTSLRYGANSPLAATVHAGVLLLVLFVLAPIANIIPLCSLAAILYVVAFNMTNIRFLFLYLKRVPLYDVFVFMVTFLLTVFFDLSKAVVLGVFISAAGPYSALFLHQFYNKIRKISLIFYR